MSHSGHSGVGHSCDAHDLRDKTGVGHSRGFRQSLPRSSHLRVLAAGSPFQDIVGRP